MNFCARLRINSYRSVPILKQLNARTTNEIEGNRDWIDETFVDVHFLSQQNYATFFVDGVKVEFFPNTIPMQERIAQDGVREVNLDIGNETRAVSFLSAEALIVLKLFFFRGKDRSDIINLVKRCNIDWDYVDTLVKILQNNSKHASDDGHGEISAYEWWYILVEQFKDAHKNDN